MDDNVANNNHSNQILSSPFHRGEQELQTRSGKREKIEAMGRRVIRSFLPDQHREFYMQLPFIVIGSVDEDGSPWSSIVSGEPGFIQSPDATTLTIRVGAINGDPLAKTMTQPKTPLGLLGIEPHTRRRNRVNGRIVHTQNNEITFGVDQSFGNCPQYIQHRSIEFTRKPNKLSEQHQIEPFSSLDIDALSLITNADTFFVSSFIQSKNQPEIEGVDVSHRGGRPGFIKIQGNTLTIPDYPGNYSFNTLGNFLINPKAGLVFADFTSGDIIMLTGSVELLWDTNEDIEAFKGADRAWTFTLSHGVRLKQALPFRAALGEVSPNTMLTGTWQEAEATKLAQQKLNEWRSFTVFDIKDESEDIRSFYLKPKDDEGLLPFKAGQYLTLKLFLNGGNKATIRTYTISSTPNEPYYKISVKKEAYGKASRYLHTKLNQGDTIEVKSPRGDFAIDPSVERPAVLIAGGVGITPMISMATHSYNESIRTRHVRPLTVFYASKTVKQRAFHNELKSLEKLSDGNIRYLSFISQPNNSEKPSVDFNGTGRINADTYKQILSLDDYDFFICGSTGFMQSQYNALSKLGVSDLRIYTEAFGSATIKRIQSHQLDNIQPNNEATTSIIKFKKSGFEQAWSKGDKTLLETAEEHGLTPEFSCRLGSCGACSTKLISGEVTYRTKPTTEIEQGNVLICCAVPAIGCDSVKLNL